MDGIIRAYKRARGRKYFPHKVVEQVVPLLFPDSRRLGRGFFKTVYRVSSTARDLALKLAGSRYIRRDIRLYRAIPNGVRNRYFAKVYWATKYCLLQKYGEKRKVPTRVLEKLRGRGEKLGLSDVRPDNIRRVDGHFKIVDANPR